MLILIILILIALTILFAKLSEKYDSFLLIMFAVVSGVAVVISSIIYLDIVAQYPFNVDKKIQMYQEENQAIETKIKETVRAYMNYEQETYQNLVQNADLTTLVIEYPELNSNELVIAEIDTYKENNNKIKELKEQQIDKRIKGFWLFFNIGVKN